MENHSIYLHSGKVAVDDGSQIHYELRQPAPTVVSATLPRHNVVMMVGAFCKMKHVEQAACRIVNHFASKAHVNVLTFNYRGVSPSTLSGPHRPMTTSLFAQDTETLIDSVLGPDSRVHVWGASMGGMVSQKLGVLLAKNRRLASLYLAVTSAQMLPSFVNRICGFSAYGYLIAPMFMRKAPQQVPTEVFLPLIYNRRDVQVEEREWFRREWTENFSDWWALADRQICTCHLSAVAEHNFTKDDAKLLEGLPVTIQVALRDKTVPPHQQKHLGRHHFPWANVVKLDQGHIISNKDTDDAFIAHLSEFIQ